MKTRHTFCTGAHLLIEQKESARRSGIEKISVSKKSAIVSPKPPSNSSVICQKFMINEILSENKPSSLEEGLCVILDSNFISSGQQNP
jgi:hypothetical protein